MSYRIFAALLFAGLAFSAAPALAQGYKGVLPSDQQESGEMNTTGAMPFMSSQMGAQSDGGHAGSVPRGGYEMDSGGLEANDTTALTDGGEGEEHAGPPDISDIYGLKNAPTGGDISDSEQGSNASSGFLAAFNTGTKDEMDGGDAPVADNMYRAMESDRGDPYEQRRQRMERSIKSAQAKRLKDIDDMNDARMRENQAKAQSELDRIRGVQEEAMERVRDAQGTSGLDNQDTQETSYSDGADGAGGDSNAEGGGSSGGGGTDN